MQLAAFEVLVEAQLVDGPRELTVGEAILDVENRARGAGDADAAVASDVLGGEGLGAVGVDALAAAIVGRGDLGVGGPYVNAPERRGGGVTEDRPLAAGQDGCHGVGDWAVLPVT